MALPIISYKTYSNKIKHNGTKLSRDWKIGTHPNFGNLPDQDFNNLLKMNPDHILKWKLFLLLRRIV